MRPRGQRTNLSEKLEIGERAAKGQSDGQIAAELGCSKWTVRKWRRCFQAQGREGLSSKRGRPGLYIVMDPFLTLRLKALPYKPFSH